MFFRQSGLLIGIMMFGLFSTTVARADAELNRQVHVLADKLAATAQASVVKGNDTEVYIAIGQKEGVLPGNRFEIVRLGDPLKVGDEIIGYEETPVAQVEASRVRERITICKVLEKTEVPKAGDKAHQLRKTINSLVVGQFSCNQSFNRLTKSLQDKLVTAMAGKGMQVVERSQLERVLKEQKLGYSGLVNSSSAKKIGQLLGADGMMLGTVNDMGNSITINARLVDLETGRTVRATEVELPKTPIIASLMAKKVADNPFSATTRSPEKEKEKHSRKLSKQQVQDVDGFSFALRGCKKSGTVVSCDLTVTNNEADRELTISATRWLKASKLFDNFGNEYEGNQVQLANCKKINCKMRMIQDLPTKVSLTFKDVASNATKASVLELQCLTKNNWYPVQFRNIPLAK